MVEVLTSTSVLYIKNGKRGKWWKSARDNGQVHVGWSNIPADLLLHANYEAIKQIVIGDKDNTQAGKPRGTGVADFNALCRLLNKPSWHIWITFEEGCLWWCTVRDGAVINPAGESEREGHFWLECARKWSNKSLVNGRRLAIAILPGTVAASSGFRATVARPTASDTILRLIRDERDDDAVKASDARLAYQATIDVMIQRLHWRDFELLIDLIFARTGWTRISILGGTLKGLDLEVENPAIQEIAFVQVKSVADQSVLDSYYQQYQEQHSRYARMIFAVHTPEGTLHPPDDPCVQVWTDDRIAQLAIRLGLGEWVESRLA